MIITKTPYRLSFFGGGSDYPEHYLKYGGAVLASSINKYCYISCRRLPPFFDHKFRIAYSKIENAKLISEIEHPAVRGVLNYLGIQDGLEIHHDGDLPARSGLGSSSSFTVGLLKALHALNGRITNNYELGLQAIEVEQKIIGETVGSQDQMSAAVGGLNRISFGTDGRISVDPLLLPAKRRENFGKHLMMFYTGISRHSQDITKEKIEGIKRQKTNVNTLHQMVDEAISVLYDKNSKLSEFGYLMNESWKIKKQLATNVSNAFIDDAFAAAMKNGALGGKIMGAGGGGFLTFFAPPRAHKNIKKALSKLVFVPFDLEYSGSTVCVYEPNGF